MPKDKKNGKKRGGNQAEEEFDLEVSFQEEIAKPYYRVDYLNDFKLPYEKLDVSAVIPTYNRCPYKPDSLKGELNPLSWAIKSLLLQKPKINEIIIVDDHSNDYTEEVVNSFRNEAKEAGVNLVYIRNKKRRGNGESRNIGARQAKSKYLFFIDDDCISAPFSAFGAVYCFEELVKGGDKVAMVGLPVYFRTSKPSKIVPKKDIGSLNFIKGVFSVNKDAFPEEYLKEEYKNEKFIDTELHILNPFRIQNANAYCLCSKQAFEEVGGFPETVIKRGEDREFGCKLTANGYIIYFQPDPKFHCVHGSYGLHTGKEFEGDDWFRKVGGNISLKKAMQECDKPAKKTGMRVEVNEYLYQHILSFFCLTYLRNKRGAINWIKKVYRDFVVKGETTIFGNGKIPVPNENERKKMWIFAINEGLEFVKEEERKSIYKINETIKQLQKEKKVDESVINILEKL